MTRSQLDGAVLVTGATGFLGREVVRQLVSRNAGAREAAVDHAVSFGAVHVLARASSERGPLADLALRWHEGDLCDPTAVDAALRDAAREAGAAGRALSIVHSAALVSYKTKDRERARAVNVEGTRTLLDAAKRHRVARFAFVSSVVTVGHGRVGEVLDETAAYDNSRLRVDYVDTKREAEELVLAAAGDLDVVVVNPGVIFGPVDRVSNTVRFIREMAIGRPPPLAPPGSVSVVGVEDAARGTLLALESGRRGARYLLVESHMSTHDLLNEIARALAVEPIRRRASRAVWRAIELSARAFDRVRPLEVLPPQALRALGVELRFDSARAKRELGWQPEPFRIVLVRTIAHLRMCGLLSTPDPEMETPRVRRGSDPAR